MSAIKQQPLHGWGHAPVAECQTWRPEKIGEIRRIMETHRQTFIARGLGRSYGDASLQPTGVICTSRLNNFIAFDTSQGILHAQAGVSLSDVMDITIPKGWLPPVIPGTRHVTLGGCFACNVHGKNHFREGEFAEHVLAIKIIMADGRSLECSPESNADLFWATAGGMGMTGIIEEVTLKLRPITSASLSTTTYRVNSLDDMVAAFEHYRDNADYMVGWIDHSSKGNELGRGVFEAANHIPYGSGSAPLNHYTPARTKLNIPVFAPSMLLNPWLMKYYNQWRFKRFSHERKQEIVGFNNFFHPLDQLGDWYKLYGKRGFFQYQCIIPESASVSNQLRALLSLIHEHRLFSFLAVLKYHREGKGLLTFSQRGYSLALDFPNTPRVRQFLPVLNSRVSELGGRVYLAKDAMLGAEDFQHMYGEHLASWQEIIHDVDLHGRFASLMSERLAWKKAG